MEHPQAQRVIELLERIAIALERLATLAEAARAEGDNDGKETIQG
jgi:hypothetical protein